MAKTEQIDLQRLKTGSKLKQELCWRLQVTKLKWLVSPCNPTHSFPKLNVSNSLNCKKKECSAEEKTLLTLPVVKFYLQQMYLCNLNLKK